MAEGNLTAAIKHVAVVTTAGPWGDSDESKNHDLLRGDLISKSRREVAVLTAGNIGDSYGKDRIYYLTIDPDVAKKLVDGREYYFKWDNIRLKEEYSDGREDGSDFEYTTYTVSVIQWTGRITQYERDNSVSIAKVRTVSSAPVNDTGDGGKIVFTYHKDSDRPRIALAIRTSEDESNIGGWINMYVWFGTDTTLNLSRPEPPRPKPPKPEPPVHHEEDMGGITVSGTNVRRIGDNTYRSEVKYYSSDAKCILKIPDRILRPSTTYSVKFTLKSGEGLDEFSTGVKLGYTRISSSANKQGDTYTMTFSTPAVLDANEISFYALGSFVKWDSHGANYFEIQNFQITSADEHVTPPAPKPPKPKTKPKFDASMEVPYPPTISKWGLWRLKFRNIGDVTLHNATMVCKLPAGLKPMTDPAASKGEFTGSLDGGIVFSEVKAGEEVGIYFYAAAEPSKLKYGSNELTTTVSATTKELTREDESLLGNNTVKVTVVYPKPEPPKPKPKPNFDLKLEANKTAVEVGEQVKFTATLTNTGNTDLHNATATATLPESVKPVGVVGSTETISGDIRQYVKLPTVGVGKSVSFSFYTEPDAELLKFGNNELSITANASTDELSQELDKSNNTVKIVVNKPKPKLSFDAAIKADKSTINIGDSVNYTIEFSNTGEVDLHNINITGTLPAGLKLVEDSVKLGAKFTGNLAGGLLLTEVKAGDKATMTFTTTTVKGKLKYGNNELSTSVSATTKELATEYSTLLDNNTATITVVYPKPQPKFNLALEADNLAIKTTETAKLTATFTNTGETDLHNTVVTAVLPAGLSLYGPIETKNITGNLQQGVKLPVVAPGKSLTFSFTVKPNAKLLKTGNNPLSVTVSATTDELGQEPDTADNAVTLTVHKPESKFNLKLEADKSTIKVNETVKLTATFANIGETDLHDIVITGTLPDVIKLASSIESNEITGDLRQGIRMPVVTPGKSVSFSFTVKPHARLLKIGDNKITVTLSATTNELEQEPNTADNAVGITIQKPDPSKLWPEEVKEVKLANNEILDDNRRELIKPIFEAVKGLKFTPMRITTEGHGWYEIGDRIAIENGKEQWQAVITSIKLTIDGGIKEEIKSIAPTATTTNYALAGGIKKTIYNTEIKVDKQKQEIAQIVSRQDKQDANIKETYTKVKQDISGVTTTIQETGGGNIIYNSVGFDADNNGKLADWTIRGKASGQSSPESLASGALSGNQIALSGGAKITQRVLVTPNNRYSLSFRVKKGALGTATVSLTNDIDSFVVTIPSGKDEYWVEHKLSKIKPTINYFDVTISLSDDVSLFAITDLMLNAGDSTMPWVQASGETLNTKVSVTKHGLKVKSNIHNGDYVEMTPLEFAGYSTVSGSLQRVFSLNRDTTTVQKLSAVQRIYMPPIMIVPVKSGEQAGWSFVKIE